MKVVLINRSDWRGGAAVASHRLVDALRSRGVDARLLVMLADRKPMPPYVEEYGRSARGKGYFLAERAGIFAANGFNRADLFKVSTARYGFDLSRHPDVLSADAILLGWVNQGALSLGGLNRLLALGKPVIWTMHDMWPATGVCHLPPDCDRYQADCGRCPLLHSRSDNDLSATTLCRKRTIYARNSNLAFVTVSRWLRDKARASRLLRDYDIAVIHNAFPIERFTTERSANSYGIGHDKIVVTMGAARLDDEVKGFDKLIELTRTVASLKPELAVRLHLLLYGSMRDASLLNQLALPFTWLGAIDIARLPELYAASDIVLSTSRFETLGGTLVEGAAAGCVPVTFGTGGQADTVSHLSTGYIARSYDIADMAAGLEWAVEQRADRASRHHDIAAKYSAHSIAGQYIDLINSKIKS